MKIDRLAFSTNAYVRRDLSDAVADIARCGYGAFELLYDRPFYPDLDAGPAPCDTHGLAVSSVNANTVFALGESEDGFSPSIVEPDETARARRLDIIGNAIALAASLDCDTVAITTGRPPEGVSRADAEKILDSSIADLLGRTAGTEVHLAIEYEPGLLVGSADSLAALFDRVGHPALGANLDIGHAFVNGEDPAALMHRFKGRIFGCHVEDIKGRRHYHLVPGNGNIDFGAFFKAAEETGYAGYFTVELYTYPNAPETVARAAFEELKKYFEGGK